MVVFIIAKGVGKEKFPIEGFLCPERAAQFRENLIETDVKKGQSREIAETLYYICSVKVDQKIGC